MVLSLGPGISDTVIVIVIPESFNIQESSGDTSAAIKGLADGTCAKNKILRRTRS